MKKILLALTLSILCSLIAEAQTERIGINVTSPQATLHVQGDSILLSSTNHSDSISISITDALNILYSSQNLNLQGESIVLGNDPSYFSPASKFTVNSTSKGILIPRLTTAERDGIVVSVDDKGLVVFDQEENQFSFFNGTNWEYIGTSKSDYWKASPNNPNNIYFDQGAVAISSDTVANGFDLTVGGKIICEEVKVKAQENWPDYVFSDAYQLMPLQTIHAFIEKNGHLPGMPSAAEVSENGRNLGEVQRILLEKIEEITLHLIRLEEENQKLKQMIWKN